MPITRSGYAPPRGTREQRGYGYQHQKLRAATSHAVAAGNVRCARCHQPIHPGQAWDLDHTDYGPEGSVIADPA